ncbi:MAG: SRPBCC domain-containing protein [Deltaproteobacteria bacterium]|nr:SRPBCC domain-containing protein [Deltaproteobacteria bacterium]
MSAKPNVADRAPLIIKRLFHAPRTQVFDAWTDPKHLARWWGPREFTNPVCKLDARPGGAIDIHMRAPDGTLYPMKGEVREVKRPERFVFTGVVEDERGNVVLENLNTVTLAEKNGITTLTLTVKTLVATEAAAPKLAGMEEGWTQSLERLMATVTEKGKELISITRLFDAPPELVFQAWSTAESMRRWFAPNGCTIEIRKYEFRVGGMLHHCIHNPVHGSCWIKGHFSDVDAPRLIAFDMGFADEQGNAAESKIAVHHEHDWPSRSEVIVSLAAVQGPHGTKTLLTLEQTALESLAKKTGAHPSWLQMLDHLAGELRK